MIQIDMPMPGCCASCRFRDPDYGFCSADYDGRVIHNKSIREEWCPLRSVAVPEQPKQIPEPKKISSLECYIDVPFSVCGKCSMLSPKMTHNKLMADDVVVENDLHIVCTNAEICMNLVMMKSEEVETDGQSFQDADPD